MRKIFVTGSKGFVGDVVCNRLEQDYEVLGDSGLVDMRYDSYFNTIKEFDPSIIVHCAALMGTEPVNRVSAYEAYDTNVLFCKKLSEFCYLRNIKLIYCASTASYKSTDNLITEDFPIEPVTWYGMTKRLGELEILKYGDKTCSLRLSMCYGPRLTYSLIPKLIHAHLTRQHAVIHLDPIYRKDFLYYTDLAEAFSLAVEKDLQGIYNVSRMQPHTVEYIISQLKVNGIDPILYVEGERDYMRNHVVSSKRFRDATGWIPKVRVEDGIVDCIKEMKSC